MIYSLQEVAKKAPKGENTDIYCQIDSIKEYYNIISMCTDVYPEYDENFVVISCIKPL